MMEMGFGDTDPAVADTQFGLTSLGHYLDLKVTYVLKPFVVKKGAAKKPKDTE